MTFDAVIVGGGIVGTACALAFSRSGMRIALVERAEIGAGATAAAMGHIVVLDGSPAQLALTRYSQMLWRSLAGELPNDVEYTQRGTLWVAADDEEVQEICRKHSAYKEHGISSDLLDAAGDSSAEPALRSGLAGGLLVHEDVVISPQVAAQFLLRSGACRQGYAGSRGGCRPGLGQSVTTRRKRAARADPRQCGRRVGLGVDARPPSGETERPSGDHGSLSWLFALPGSRARISEERSRHNH